MLNDILTDLYCIMEVLSANYYKPEDEIIGFLETHVRVLLKPFKIDAEQLNFHVHLYQTHKTMLRCVHVRPLNSYTQECLDDLEVYLALEKL